MHAHSKHERPTAKRSAATNDTSLTNDQRNKLDHAMPYMPVRALYTHTSTTRAVPCASACPHTFHARRAALCYPNQLRRQAQTCTASQTCAAWLS